MNRDGRTQINRRQFLRLAGMTGGLIVASAATGMGWEDGPNAPTLAFGRVGSPSAQTRSGLWTQAGAADFRSGQLAGLSINGENLVLESGARLGSYLSIPRQADFPFNAVAASWKADLGPGGNLALEVRTRDDGTRWSDWFPLNVVDRFAGQDVKKSDLVAASGSHLQYRVKMLRNDGGLSPELNEVTVTYIDSSGGPSLIQAKAAAALGRGYPYSGVEPSPVGPLKKPTIISRAAWGADESYRFSGGEESWMPEYVPWTKAVLHHTATSNDSDAINTVRAIYYYHAISLQWGDIGYNYLIDRDGNIYEGRFGGENVQGGHVYGYNGGTAGIAVLGNYTEVGITRQSERSVGLLLGWLCSRRGIGPLNSGFFVDKTLPNIMGHRDATQTTCPGDRFYAIIPRLRSNAMSQLTPYALSWGSHTVPSYAKPLSVLRVNVAVRNAGTNTWRADPSNPYRLGYQWFDANGKRYVQEALQRRTDIPGNVALGEEITINAPLFVPSKEGRYILKWDIVHEGDTWFVDKGNDTLDVPVSVYKMVYGAGWRSHTTPASMIPGYTASVMIEVENTGARAWSAKGATPFHLGYHWYDASGNQYYQRPADDYRSDLPNDVAPGQKVSVSALVVAPRSPGNYTLKWDLVQEGVTWFADQANKTLDVPVQVVALPLPVSPESLDVTIPDKNVLTFRPVSISNPAQQSLAWNARAISGDWLGVNSSWGSAPGTVIISIDSSKLPDGVYQGLVRLTGVVGDTQLYARDIPVRITVGAR